MNNMKWRQVYRTKPQKQRDRKFRKRKKLPIVIRWALPTLHLVALLKYRAVLSAEGDPAKLRTWRN
ncbi:MAG: hypothetical protein EBE86_014445 [Hormoscilla sp. GUM202]|nr:hypothetical protein [Hormoscilla sp. GUM202]